MGLVNVAAELVKAGRCVLIVDFDLEAPGLDTFNLPRPQSPSKGIVEFVQEYLDTGQSPDVTQFTYKSLVPNTTGQLWVMPAGKPDANYDCRFKSIDWQDLYENRDGYVLFEDLRAQWDQQFQPDYVLIDSRTGHTDVGGICTRQLPDSVALFFFPNEQNRRGLETVLGQIRHESVTDRKKTIKLHFVMSNVPELDDEEGFLASSVAKLKKSLEFDTFSAVIHHYDNLALVTQSVFTLDRPRTRLAREYRELADAIRKANPDDRDAALEFLDEIAPQGGWRRFQAGEVKQRIQDILTRHSADTEVLTRLATVLSQQGQFADSLALMEEAGSLGAKGSGFLLRRAELYFLNRNQPGALRDISELLKSADATYFEIGTAVQLLLQLDEGSLEQLLDSPAFKNLDAEGRSYVADVLLQSVRTLPVAAAILRSILAQPNLTAVMRSAVQQQFVLALIGDGQFAAAVDVIKSDPRKSLTDLGIEEAFNYAMAQWGLTSNPSAELFRRVVELDQVNPRADANGHQCLSIAHWAINEPDKALVRLGEAWQAAMSHSKSDFSAWSYLKVLPKRFLEDLKEIQQLIEGEPIKPRFMRSNPTTQGSTDD